MIPALIAVGALALTTGVAAGAAGDRAERAVVIERPAAGDRAERAVVIERPAAGHVEPRRQVTYVVRPGERATAEWRVRPATEGGRSVRSWTPNMHAGTHNGYDANQG